MPDAQQFDLIPIVLSSFKGGVNFSADPLLIGAEELADAQNYVLTPTGTLEQRKGYAKYNSTAIGASTSIRSGCQFRNLKGTYYTVVQASDSKVYYGATAAPGTITSFTSLFTETASSSPAVFIDILGALIMTNNVDEPQIWEGVYGQSQGCLFTQNTDVSYFDYTDAVRDEADGTFAIISGMDTLANGDALYIGSYVPKLKGIRLEFVSGQVNTNASVVSIHYWNGNAWTAVANASDGTIASAGKTMGQDGDITFDEVTCAPRLVGTTYFRYWLRVTVSAALDASVQIKAIYLMYNMQDLTNLWDGTLVNPSDVRQTTDNGANYTDETSDVTDGSASTQMDLDSFNTLANEDWFLVGSTSKFHAVKFDMDASAFNDEAATLTCHYWNGAWTALTISDGTAVGTDTLKQDGYVWFAIPSDWYPSDPTATGTPYYYLRFTVSAQLSADVDVEEIDLVPMVDPLPVFKLCAAFKNRLILGNTPEAPNAVWISAEDNPYDNNSSDSDIFSVTSSEGLTALRKYYNELFTGTLNEVYLLQGSTIATFQWLRIETNGVGPINHHCVTGREKEIYFAHSSGFYLFDGIHVEPISYKVNKLFDASSTTYFIPVARLDDIHGRWNGIDNCVEWTLSMGSSATANNKIFTFNVVHKGWMIHNIAAVTIFSVTGSDGVEYYYHGDTTGFLYRDYTTNLDVAATITAFITSRALPGMADQAHDTEGVYRGIHILMKTQSSGTVTTAYALSGATSFTTYYASNSMANSGSTYVWARYNDPIVGHSLQVKVTNATSNVPCDIHAIKVLYTPVRLILI